MAESSGASPKKEVKGILKKGSKDHKDATESDHHHGAGGIQWDEMNILMTESPAGKDYGHMKIEEPKTPYHEMLPDEEETPVAGKEGGGGGGGGASGNFLSPDDLAKKVSEAARSKSPPSKWDTESSGSEEDMITDEQREHKKKFKEWRKKHYNEFFAVKRARELLKQDEEELARLEQDEPQGSKDETEEMQQDA